MSALAAVSVVQTVANLIDKWVPDKDLATKIKADAASQEFQGDIAIALAQINANAEASKSDSVFVAGGRPFIIWVCGFALAWHFVLRDMLGYILAVIGVEIPPLPELETEDLFYLVSSLLGVGGFRTYEKLKGVARGKI